MASITAVFHALAMVLFLSISAMAANHPNSFLKVGYYRRTCPSAEAIIKKTVFDVVLRNLGMVAGLIHMHFHDCFVRGCDASVLLKSTPGNPAERDHPANNPSLRGSEIIDQAKARLEASCPNTVSCADIVAFPARGSVDKAGGIIYDVPTGRHDGRVSHSLEVTQNLPPPIFNTTQLIANFGRKGLSVDEMVTLSGAHSIGISHCSSFSSRLYTFKDTLPQDPSLNPAYAAFLKNKCLLLSKKPQSDPTVPLNSITADTLDDEYYLQLPKLRGLLALDETLYTSPSTSRMVVKNAKNGFAWSAKFAKAMVKMGSMDVLTGKQGEIRKICSVVN